MFSNQIIFKENEDKSKNEDVPDVVRPASKPSSKGMVSGFSLQNNQNMRYTFKGALTNTGLHIPRQSEFLKTNSNNDFTHFMIYRSIPVTKEDMRHFHHGLSRTQFEQNIYVELDFYTQDRETRYSALGVS